jgi:hypothetical protein
MATIGHATNAPFAWRSSVRFPAQRAFIMSIGGLVGPEFAAEKLQHNCVSQTLGWRRDPPQGPLSRSLTPGPPPLASMNSTPAPSSARRMAKLFGAVIDVSPTVSSARRIVVAPTEEALARSAALQRMRALAARIWALVRGGGMLTNVSTRNKLFHEG